MRWSLAVLAAVLMVPSHVQAGQVALSLELRPTTVILGEPLGFKVEWRNGTDAPVSLSTCDTQEGFRRWLVVRRPDGALEHGRWESRAMPMHPLAPGATATFVDDLQGSEPSLFATPGRYQVWAEHVSAGRVYMEGQIAGQPLKYWDYWKGRVESNVCDLEVREPTGVDREAYDRFGGQPMRAPELLRDFPTSTYTAYVIRDFTSRGLSGSANDAIVDEFKDGAAGVLRDIPCPPSVSPCVQHDTLETRGVKALDWTAEWIDLVLKTHPDIWFADEMRLRLALDEFIAGKSALGASDLENLAKNARPEIAEKASEILALLKQKEVVH
jgi:hypothetical protein